jgi:hypothetical protein
LKTMCRWRLPDGFANRLESLYCKGAIQSAEFTAMALVQAGTIKGYSLEQVTAYSTRSALATPSLFIVVFSFKLSFVSPPSTCYHTDYKSRLACLKAVDAQRVSANFVTAQFTSPSNIRSVVLRLASIDLLPYGLQIPVGLLKGCRCTKGPLYFCLFNTMVPILHSRNIDVRPASVLRKTCLELDAEWHGMRLHYDVCGE